MKIDMLLEIVSGECRALLKRPSVLAILFGIPALYTILFGMMYGANVVKYMPLAVYDQNQTALSRSLIQAFADSERFEIVMQATSQEELDRYLQTKQAVAALVIPPQFARDVKMSAKADVLVMSNATNLMFANGVLSTSQEIVQTFAAAAGQKLIEGVNQPPAQALRSVLPIRLGVRVVDNPTTAYSYFILSGLTVNGLQLAIYLVACTLMTAEYAILMGRRQWRPWEIIVGKMLPCWLLSVASLLVSIGILVVWFKHPFRGSLAELVLNGSAFAFAITNLGLFISTACPNILATMQNTAIYIMSAFLCCGYSWPEFAMNSFAKVYAMIAPITYAASTVRDIMLSSYTPAVFTNSLILFTYGGTFCILSILLFSKRRERLGSRRDGV